VSINNGGPKTDAMTTQRYKRSPAAQPRDAVVTIRKSPTPAKFDNVPITAGGFKATMLRWWRYLLLVVHPPAPYVATGDLMFQETGAI
jgi:hypothetical protein